jgi:phosphoribosylanthranilate isomerase
VKRVRTKICGVTTPEDALYALECGADAIGLNFHPASPRYLSLERAASIVDQLPPFSVTVGVFVDHSIEEVTEIARRLNLSAVQTYNPDALGQLPRDIPHIPAFRIAVPEQLQDVTRRLDILALRQLLPAAILLDSFVPGEMGGTGHKAPWDLLANFRPPVPVILAGGLTPDNVVDAIKLVQPWGVDVASGVESKPGFKDPGKLRMFVQNVRFMTG